MSPLCCSRVFGLVSYSMALVVLYPPQYVIQLANNTLSNCMPNPVSSVRVHHATCMHTRCRDQHSVWHMLLHSGFHVRTHSTFVATSACSMVTVLCILLCSVLPSFMQVCTCAQLQPREKTHMYVSAANTCAFYCHCCNQLHTWGLCFGC